MIIIYNYRHQTINTFVKYDNNNDNNERSSRVHYNVHIGTFYDNVCNTMHNDNIGIVNVV